MEYFKVHIVTVIELSQKVVRWMKKKRDDFIDEESDFDDIHDDQNKTQDQVDKYDQKQYNRSDAIREEIFFFASFGESMLSPFRSLCGFAYGIDMFGYFPIRTFRYRTPEEFKSQKHNFIHLKGQIITPTLAIYVKNSLNLLKKYPIEVKFFNAENLIETIDNQAMMSSQSEKILNESISQMIQCDTNICFVSDQNKTIMLHYQKKW
ncbi:hypothetical protein BN7_1679 [Wickerhamomyces ciferrii]|uniref:Uncharacterized protein n=1 Tax=Wickerhamomyces ciferrii (strain ATCC 14091 / BCRC 22168 / CBS 111 / JCM 3599 / NBRC 0793 / NRRL Y-1031 F-60-10) TaxID=1206466 RepID=K0KAV9_WICCF|nr:uncharacterized protein BN7_1679 [Wickerhamomyces ciferrii]CCH42135.1 hypothetical protein BN7_1679 [Wickerhamomyces ciferrii]